MSKFVLIFVAALASAVVAFPNRKDEGFQVAPMRIIRSADPDPSFYHLYNYGSDYENDENYGGYGDNEGGYRIQEYGNGYNNRPHGESSSNAQSSANAGSINSPYGSSSYANAQSSAGSNSSDR